MKPSAAATVVLLVLGEWAAAQTSVVERDQRGQEFGRVSDTIAMRLKQATYEQMLKTGAPYQHAIALSPKADVLRVVVRDARSVTIPTAALVR